MHKFAIYFYMLDDITDDNSLLFYYYINIILYINY